MTCHGCRIEPRGRTRENHLWSIGIEIDERQRGQVPRQVFEIGEFQPEALTERQKLFRCHFDDRIIVRQLDVDLDLSVAIRRIDQGDDAADVAILDRLVEAELDAPVEHAQHVARRAVGDDARRNGVRRIYIGDGEAAAGSGGARNGYRLEHVAGAGIPEDEGNLMLRRQNEAELMEGRAWRSFNIRHETIHRKRQS